MDLANIAALTFYCYYVLYLGHIGSQAVGMSSTEARCLFVGKFPPLCNRQQFS